MQVVVQVGTVLVCILLAYTKSFYVLSMQIMLENGFYILRYKNGCLVELDIVQYKYVIVFV